MCGLQRLAATRAMGLRAMRHDKRTPKVQMYNMRFANPACLDVFCVPQEMQCVRLEVPGLWRGTPAAHW